MGSTGFSNETCAPHKPDTPRSLLSDALETLATVALPLYKACSSEEQHNTVRGHVWVCVC